MSEHELAGATREYYPDASTVAPGYEPPYADELLRRFAAKGIRTSEFWLAVLVISIWPMIDALVEWGHATAQASGKPWLQIVAAGVAAAYAVARGIVKAAGLRALLTPVPPPVQTDTGIQP